MALTKTSSIIKTRSQSRTDSRTIAPAPAPVAVATGGRTTGTNDRTIDSVNPVAATATTGRTTGTNLTIDTDVAPAPVDDLFAGRPTTGALKDPPAPRDRDSDDAKKPAAKPKPKGRPKKVVAPKTRKPRKPRTDPADDLVDPMSRVHVGDAGGLARASGSDPVLADMDYSNPEQDPEQPDDEPQPKKKTRLRFALQAMDPICLKPSSNFLKFKGYLIVFGNYLCL